MQRPKLRCARRRRGRAEPPRRAADTLRCDNESPRVIAAPRASQPSHRGGGTSRVSVASSLTPAGFRRRSAAPNGRGLAAGADPSHALAAIRRVPTSLARLARPLLPRSPASHRAATGTVLAGTGADPSRSTGHGAEHFVKRRFHCKDARPGRLFRAHPPWKQSSTSEKSPSRRFSSSGRMPFRERRGRGSRYDLGQHQPGQAKAYDIHSELRCRVDRWKRIPIPI